MRLTLRTLLAYLDGVLDPDDAKSLKDKIAESRFAKTLIENIRLGLKRPQLSAPPVDGKGLAGNPNSVAEYLDNTLAVERIPEFERICLESEVMLVEVAACHQILTVAVGQQIEASELLRSRIQNLPSSMPTQSGRVAPSKSATDKEPSLGRTVQSKPELVKAELIEEDSATEAWRQQPSAASRPATTIRQKGLDLSDANGSHGVPAYLRTARSSGWRQALITGSLIALLLFVLWQSIGSLDRLRALFATRPATIGVANGTIQGDELKEPQRSEANERVPSQPQVESKDSDVKQRVASPETGVAANVTDQRNSVAKGDLGNQAASPANANQSDMENKAASDASATAGNGSLKTPFDDLLGGNGNQEDSQPKPPVTKLPDNLDPSFVIGGTWLPNDRASSDAVVLAFERPAENQPVRVQRLSPGVAMKLGSHVLMPPASRTAFSLPPGIRLESVGPSEVEFLRGVPSPIVQLHRGRMVLNATPDCQACDVVWNGQKASLKWESTGGVCAVELYQSYLPGTDGLFIVSSLQITPIVDAVQCVLNVGNQVQGGEAAPADLQVGQSLVVSSLVGPNVIQVSGPPAWLDPQSERAIDLAASKELAQLMKVGGEAMPLDELRGLTTYRRIETAALSARTLSEFGVFDPYFGANGLLNNPNARAHWELALLDLRQVLSAHPELVGRLVQDIDATCGERAERIRWLLFGPSNAQLEQGGDAELVAMLNSQSLDERVLSIHYLRWITGQDFGYLAERPMPESLLAWKKALGEGQIRVPAALVPPRLPGNP